MLEFMRNGGFPMWVMLITALGAVGLAAIKPRESRALVLGAGSFLSVIQGILGMSLGMVAVSMKYTRFPDHTAAIAEGLGELSNNGIFGASLALALGIAALATHRGALRVAA